MQRQACAGTQVSNSHPVLLWSTFQRSEDLSLAQQRVKHAVPAQKNRQEIQNSGYDPSLLIQLIFSRSVTAVTRMLLQDDRTA